MDTMQTSTARLAMTQTPKQSRPTDRPQYLYTASSTWTGGQTADDAIETGKRERW